MIKFLFEKCVCVCVCVCVYVPVYIQVELRKDTSQMELILSSEWGEVQILRGWVGRSASFSFYTTQINGVGLWLNCIFIYNIFLNKKYEVNICIKKLAFSHKDKNSLNTRLVVSVLTYKAYKIITLL